MWKANTQITKIKSYTSIQGYPYSTHIVQVLMASILVVAVHYIDTCATSFSQEFRERIFFWVAYVVLTENVY